MQIQNPLGDGQAEPGTAARAVIAARLPAVKPVEQMRDFLSGNPATRVANPYVDLGTPRRQRDLHCTTGAGIAQGIVDQVVQHALDQADVGQHQGQLLRDVPLQIDIGLPRTELKL